MSDLLQIKERIKKLVEQGYFIEAKRMIGSLKEVTNINPDIVSIESVILYSLGEYYEAKRILEEALILFPFEQDLLFNLASIEEGLGNYQSAYDYYYDLFSNGNASIRQDVELALSRVKGLDQSVKNREKVVFFCKKGLDSFLDNVVGNFKKEFYVKKVIVTDLNQINQGMEWADLSWFEWCDELLIYGSNLPLAESKNIICRLHSYEAFTIYINQVKWSSVNKVIFVADHIKQYVLEQESSLKENQVAVIPNGIDLSKFTYKDRKKGFNIAFVGYINYKKGPMLLLQSFKAIYDYDQRYQLHIAGEFQDPRYVLYFKQMIEELGIKKNVFFHGWQKDINRWLEDKNYIISTSVLESQHLSIMEAMAKGIKPLVHNFAGAKKVYDEKFIWNTPSDLIRLIKNDYKSNDYLQYIKSKYDILAQSVELINVVKDISSHTRKYNPLITVGIINYNYSHYLDECLASIQNQTYKNLDVLIIDDCSTDGSIEKIKKIESKYLNVRTILHKKNVGHAIKAIQEIVEHAQGEYIVMMSADDCYLKNTALEEQVNVLISNPDVDYVYGNLQLMDEQRNPMEVWRYKDYSSQEVVKLVFERGGSGVLPMTIGMYRTDFYQSQNRNWIHNEKDLVGADTFNSLVNSNRGWRTRYLDSTLYGYRRHNANMSTNGLKKRIDSLIVSLEYIVNNFDETIYLPQIPWGKLDKKDLNKNKNFYIGKHYFNWFEHYFKNGFNLAGQDIDLEDTNIISSLESLLSHSERYLQDAVLPSNSAEVQIYLNKINKYKSTNIARGTEVY